MKPQELMICKGWITALYPQKKEALSSLLAHQDAQIFSSLPNPTNFNPEHLKSAPLEKIHFSWFTPYLRTLSTGEIPLFLAAFNKEQSESLAHLLGYGGLLPTLTKLGKQALCKFMQNQLLHNQQLVPLSFLPESSYNLLLDLLPQKLSRLIRYLGLHDLAFEMRQIIDTKKLKKIFSSLTKREGEFLNSLLLHTEPLTFKRLFLQNWDGTKEHLQKLLDERGLHRLGHALYNESENFIWYFTHRLDMHQAGLLLKYKVKPTHARAQELLKRQIEKILQEDS